MTSKQTKIKLNIRLADRKLIGRLLRRDIFYETGCYTRDELLFIHALILDLCEHPETAREEITRKQALRLIIIRDKITAALED